MSSAPQFLGHSSLEDCLAVYSDGSGHRRKIFAVDRPDIGAIECRTGGYGMKLRRWYAHTRHGLAVNALIDTASWSSFWKQRRFNVRLFNQLPDYAKEPHLDQLSFDFVTTEICSSVVDRLAA